MPLEDLSGLKFSSISDNSADNMKFPGFFRGTLKVDELADTFLSMEGWKKGVVFINGFNLGRYWEIGPTKTMYVPAPLLRKGDNEIIVFELEGAEDLSIEFVSEPDLG